MIADIDELGQTDDKGNSETSICHAAAPPGRAALVTAVASEASSSGYARLSLLR